MAKVLVIHHDRKSRSTLETAVGSRHQVHGASDLTTAVRRMVKHRAEVVIVGHDKEKKHALRLMKYMRDNVMKTPVVVVFSRGAGTDQLKLQKLGAKGFVDDPVDPDRLETVIQRAVKARAAVDAAPPPVTSEEMSGNLTMMERNFNNKMRCFAGRNQVYIQSTIMGSSTSRPRIALKCHLRHEFGLNRDVHYEWIRDVCCGDPTQCEAYQQFMATRESDV